MNKFRIISILVILAILFSSANLSPAEAQAGTIFYVKQAATGSGDGLSWANATTLQTPWQAPPVAPRSGWRQAFTNPPAAPT